MNVPRHKADTYVLATAADLRKEWQPPTCRSGAIKIPVATATGDQIKVVAYNDGSSMIVWENDPTLIAFTSDPALADAVTSIPERA